MAREGRATTAPGRSVRHGDRAGCPSLPKRVPPAKRGFDESLATDSVTDLLLASTKLAIKYAVFAVAATAVNIAAQDLVIRSYNGAFAILGSIAVGTGAGLIVKYVLDKRYIFRFRAHNMVHDTRTLALYTVMGVVTTFIFWGFELGFHHLFETKKMRYLGGVMGLVIGYLTKYRLDKRFVFRVEAA